jgi:glutamate carboxypeptidase
MNSLEASLAALAGRSGEILPLIEELVRLNSYSKNVAGVNAVGERLGAALAPLPLAVRQVDGGPDWGTHWCFSTQAADALPALLLIGHHDTVFPPGTFEGFALREGRAHGPGVLDMKGGLAIVITALRCLHDAGLLEQLPLCFVSVADEEVGSRSSAALLRELARSARAALVFEAGRDGDLIVTSRRGSGSARVRAEGRAAHAGNALHDGRNAIWSLATFVDRAQRLNGSLPGTTLSTGLIAGGSARNTVAEHAHAELDLRFEDARGKGALLDALGACARHAMESVEGTRVEVRAEVTREPWERTDASSALCARYGAAQRAAGLAAGEAPRQGGGSDANTVGAQGLPAIDGLGPRGRGYHTHDEYIEVASLLPKTEALLRFVLGELTQSDAV